MFVYDDSLIDNVFFPFPFFLFTGLTFFRWYMLPHIRFCQMGRPGNRYSLKVFNGTRRFIGFSLVLLSSRSRHDVDRIFQVSKSFTEINEAEIDEKYLEAKVPLVTYSQYALIFLIYTNTHTSPLFSFILSRFALISYLDQFIFFLHIHSKQRTKI